MIVSLLEDIENRFLGEYVVEPVGGFRVNRKNQIGKKSCRDIEKLAKQGLTVNLLQVGEYPNHRYKVFYTP